MVTTDFSNTGEGCIAVDTLRQDNRFEKWDLTFCLFDCLFHCMYRLHCIDQ